MKKRLVSIFLAVALLLSSLPMTAFAASRISFKDVAANSWYHDAVRYVQENGIMSGIGNGLFSPETTLTRAQLCQIIYNMEGKPGAGSSNFSDVGAGAWYKNAVSWSAAHDIVNGTGNGRFSPDLHITREQMVTILYRYAAYKNYNLSVPISLSDYSDANRISGWAKEALQWAVSEKVISGTTTTTISPQGTTTRAQAATMLMRFCQRMEAKEQFYAKNVDDFRGAEIINFDNSNETNFAVLAEDTVASESSATANQLVSVDEESGVYRFSNIDQKISSLTPGDVFYFTYGTGADDYLLLKVGSISIDGDTATITEGKADLSDYFQYIDVDVDVDVPGKDFGSGHNAALQKNNALSPALVSAQNPQAAGSGDAVAKAIPAAIAKDMTGNFSTDLKIEVKGDVFSYTTDAKLTLKLKICYDKNILDVEEISLSVKQEYEFEGKVSKSLAEKTYKKEFASVTIPIMGGIDAKITPYFEAKAKASVGGSFSGKVTFENGTKYSANGNQPIQTSDGEFSKDIIEGDFKVSAGLGISVGVTVLKVIDLSLDGESGIEMRGDVEVINTNSFQEERHLCASCTDGTIDVYFKLEFEVKAGVIKKWTLVEWTLAKANIELAKFYISFLGGAQPVEFGWGKCPHKQYLVSVIATDQFGNRLADVSVELTDAKTGDMPVPGGKTGKDGTYKTYCANGDYKVVGFGLNGYQKAAQTITINGKAVAITLQMEKQTSGIMTCDVYDYYAGYGYGTFRSVVGTATMEIQSDKVAIFSIDLSSHSELYWNDYNFSFGVENQQFDWYTTSLFCTGVSNVRENHWNGYATRLGDDYGANSDIFTVNITKMPEYFGEYIVSWTVTASDAIDFSFYDLEGETMLAVVNYIHQ